MAPPAHAAFPGVNGRIAFSRENPSIGVTDVWSVDPSGHTVLRITDDGISANPVFSPDGTVLAFSSGDEIHVAGEYGADRRVVVETGTGVGEMDWSPDGTRLAVELAECATWDCATDIFVVGLDGTGLTNLTNSPFDERNPAWSPDGARIAFDRIAAGEQDIYTIDPDGSDETNLTAALPEPAGQPDWSPDGGRIVSSAGVMNADGTVTEPQLFLDPAWSPDGSYIATNGISYRPAGGGDSVVVTRGIHSGNVYETFHDRSPDWQARAADPSPPPKGSEYPRPRGARPMRLALVMAYEECVSPNRTHAPPLAHPSCAPPVRPGRLTVGTPDANDMPAQAVGHLRINPIRGDATTVEDEADVRLTFHQTDVLRQGNTTISDFSGALRVRLDLRVTDWFNAGGDDGLATVMDYPIDYDVQCAVTPEPIGSTCALDTTVDALVPGLIRERKRTVWQVQEVQVLDPGSQPGAVERVFLVPGVFVP